MVTQSKQIKANEMQLELRKFVDLLVLMAEKKCYLQILSAKA